MKDENKKIFSTSNLIIMVICIILSVVMTLIIINIMNTKSKLSYFKIESFNMDTETTTYTYSDDLITYEGKGIISCKDKKNDYIVLLEQINKTDDETDYLTIVIHNGEGSFTTYDSSYTGATKKPEYEFNIIGYNSFEK